jgi:hypothetical protein
MSWPLNNMKNAAGDTRCLVISSLVNYLQDWFSAGGIGCDNFHLFWFQRHQGPPAFPRLILAEVRAQAVEQF